MVLQVDRAPLARVRARVRTVARGDATPQRLRRVGTVLVVGVLLTGLIALVAGIDRAGAVDESTGRLAALTADAAEIYRSLADADAAATSGYVSGGAELPAVRARYDADIAAAAAALVRASARLPDTRGSDTAGSDTAGSDAAGSDAAGPDPAADALSTIATQLPVYTGLVDTARTYNRQGLPLGQSYLGSASRLMRETVLPAAARLRAIENERLGDAFGRGGVLPVAVLVLSIAVLLALVDASVRERHRTQRVLNVGLVGAAVAVAALLVWWSVVAAVTGSALAAATRHATASAALDDARAAVLQARSNESLVLVARGSGTVTDRDFTDRIALLLAARNGPLSDAQDAGADVAPVRAAVAEFAAAHVVLRSLDDDGRYAEAVASSTGADPTGSGAAFDRADAALGEALTVERAGVEADAATARAAVTGLPVGSALLGLLAAAGVVVGISRRTGEYR